MLIIRFFQWGQDLGPKSTYIRDAEAMLWRTVMDVALGTGITEAVDNFVRECGPVQDLLLNNKAEVNAFFLNGRLQKEVKERSGGDHSDDVAASPDLQRLMGVSHSPPTGPGGEQEKVDIDKIVNPEATPPFQQPQGPNDKDTTSHDSAGTIDNEPMEVTVRSEDRPSTPNPEISQAQGDEPIEKKNTKTSEREDEASDMDVSDGDSQGAHHQAVPPDEQSSHLASGSGTGDAPPEADERSSSHSAAVMRDEDVRSNTAPDVSSNLLNSSRSLEPMHVDNVPTSPRTADVSGEAKAASMLASSSHTKLASQRPPEIPLDPLSDLTSSGEDEHSAGSGAEDIKPGLGRLVKKAVKFSSGAILKSGQVTKKRKLDDGEVKQQRAATAPLETIVKQEIFWDSTHNLVGRAVSYG